MRKFLKSFPSTRFMVISVLVGMLVGVVLGGGFQLRGLVLGAVLGVLFIIMMTTRNYDPDAWNEIYNPQAHTLRQQVRKQAVATDNLQAIVTAFDKNDYEKLEAELLAARKLFESKSQDPKQ